MSLQKRKGLETQSEVSLVRHKASQRAEKKGSERFSLGGRRERSFDSAQSQVKRDLHKSEKYEIISNFVVFLSLNFVTLYKARKCKGCKAEMFFCSAGLETLLFGWF